MPNEDPDLRLLAIVPAYNEEAGVVEAAFAGALGLRLGGRTVYAHRVEDRPHLGDGLQAVEIVFRHPAIARHQVGEAAVRRPARLDDVMARLELLWVRARSTWHERAGMAGTHIDFDEDA